MQTVMPILFLLLSYNLKLTKADNAPSPDINPNKFIYHVNDLKNYAASQHANTQIGILVDMSVPAYKNRIFLVDLENDSVLVKGICAHGRGQDDNSEEVTFSNQPGSLCTSEGRYKIGTKYAGQYGYGYKLHGLDSTNSNAYKRDIVFHYYPIVPDEEYKQVCLSFGCPMVSKNVFEAAAKYLDGSKKPVLMWIYK
jgi:hypothetical protein